MGCISRVSLKGAEQMLLKHVRRMEVCYAHLLRHKLPRALHSAFSGNSTVCLQRGGGALG